MPNNAYPQEVIDKIREMRAAGITVRVICDTLKIGEKTVQRHTRDIKVVGNTGPRRNDQALGAVTTAGPIPTCPFPAPEAGGPKCPEPIVVPWEPFIVELPGVVGVLTDAHIPYHDMPTINAWVAECKRRNANTLLLNGDILDCGEVSAHYREPNETRLEEELIAGEQFIQWLRSMFPQSRIIWKQGNHEFRIPRYISSNAPALFNLKQLSIPSLLSFDKYGVEWIEDKRTIMLGKLPVVHGHEFKGGGGVNPARWLYLRAGSTSMCGHFHRTSEHHEQTLDRKLHGVWSIGCACFLYPKYDPNNKWNNGFAIVEVEGNGKFSVTNKRLLRDGTIC